MVAMGGQAAIRGYLLQTLVAVLDVLSTDDWLSVQLEPKDRSQNVDILWGYVKSVSLYCFPGSEKFK